MDILVVEQEPSALDAMADAFEGRTHFRLEAASPEMDALGSFEAGRHSVVILGWEREESGPSLCRKLRRAAPGVGVVFATRRAATVDKLEAFRAGADLYLVKPLDARELAAHVAALGRRVTPARAQAARATAAQPSPDRADAAPLTAQQNQILVRVSVGLTNKEIAVEVGCSVKNVEYHVGRLLRKAGCSSRSQLVAWSLRQVANSR